MSASEEPQNQLHTGKEQQYIHHRIELEPPSDE